MEAQMNPHRAGRYGYLVMVIGAILVSSLAALVTSACGGGARTSPGAFEESDLAAIVRGSGDDSDGMNLVEDESGSQTLAQVAYELQISRSSLRKCGFVAASEAFFEGRQALPQTAQAILFADPGGASCFLRLARDVLDADEVADARPIDASSLGADAFGFSADFSFWEGSFYFWRVGNLVLGVFAQSERARAFADKLDEQAHAIG